MRFYVKRTGSTWLFSYFIVTIILKNTKEYKQFFKYNKNKPLFVVVTG